MATMREQHEQARRRRRRALRKATGLAGLCLLIAASAVGFTSLKHDPPPYDAAATRACLSSLAHVAPVQRLWSGYPFITVRFPHTRTDEEWNLVFAPSTSAARSSEMPDSERLLRRRNVLAADRLAGAPWDPRILRCLKPKARPAQK